MICIRNVLTFAEEDMFRIIAQEHGKLTVRSKEPIEM